MKHESDAAQFGKDIFKSLNYVPQTASKLI